MRTLILSLLVCTVVAVAAAAARADVLTRVVSETNGELVVEFENTGTTKAPVGKVVVAVPPNGNYSVDFGASAVVRLDEPPKFDGGEPLDSVRTRLEALDDTLRVSAPIPFRGLRLLYIEFEFFKVPIGSDVVYKLVAPTLTVTYDPTPTTRTAQTVDPFVRDLVLNESVFPGTARSGGPDPWFSLAPRWVRIPVAARGLYTITPEDLTALGVNPLSVNNPESFRLYSTLGRQQPRSLADPTGSWMPGNAMDEVAILVEDGGDGTFNGSDRIVFYGVAATDWADVYDPSAPDSVYQRRPRTGTNYYYLTWDGQLPGQPARVATLAGAPQAGVDATTYVERYWGERDLLHFLDYGGDGWLWLDVLAGTSQSLTLETVDFSNVDTSQPQTFRSLGLAPYKSPAEVANINQHTLRFTLRQGTSVRTIGVSQWTSISGEYLYEHGVPLRHDGYFLSNGSLTFRMEIPSVSQGNPNPADFGYFAWFSVEYHRFLRASGNSLGFSGPDTTDTVTFAVDNFTSPASPYVFDVTDMRAPKRITGVSSSGSRLRFSATFAGERRHFWTATQAGLATPAGMQLYTAPTDLRSDAVGPNLVIVANPAFLSAAQRLRSHRLQNLPHFSNPRVKVVTTTELYDNFSGGMPDAMAIRNYAKFLYDNYSDAYGNPSLAYLLLLGDGNEDLRNAASSQPDPVPTNLFFTRPWTFVTDEWFAQLDPEDQVSGYAVMDIAVGRLPAVTTGEADLLVDKVIRYETDPTFGEWRRRQVLVADDHEQGGSGCQTSFTEDSEELAREHSPEFIEIRRIYLSEYAAIASVKPAARAAFLEEWNRGAQVINYIGHGSNRSMADEQVFVDADVAQLDNGGRLPLLLALSCTIGDFGNYRNKSLSEKLLLRSSGGVVGTITAAAETYEDRNKRLNFPLFERLLPKRVGEIRQTIGQALMGAKLLALYNGNNATTQEHNNWKYNLLTDPALRPRVPEHRIVLELAETDTLVAGLRRTVRGAVYRNGSVDTSFNGAVGLLVREPDNQIQWAPACIGSANPIDYLIPGGVLFDGSTAAVGGQFEFNFRVPRGAARGPLSFISAYADNGITDAVQTLDSTLVLVSPTVADSTGLRPADGPPRVSLGFKSGLNTVKPGETLQAVVRDADGINILDTTNEGRQAIVFDDLPVPLDANEFFEFDQSGTDTSGVLLFPLPDLDFGQHRAVYKVSDAFGQTTLDTLVFSVTDPRAFTAEVLFNYPNPFTDDTSFLVRLSDRATIRLDIFTVSGRRIRRLEAVRDGGEVWIHWDGRDHHGSEIANGIYLYVARVEFADVDRPPLELRGKLARIE
jgi:hypothetical protein